MLVVMLMVFAVNTLLLMAVQILFHSNGNSGRVLLGSLIGTMLASVAMLPGLGFLRNILWRLCCLLLSATVAFGFGHKTLFKTLIFLLLQMSVGGTVQTDNSPAVLLGAAGIALSCQLAEKESQYIPVELCYGGKRLHITALRDTGNGLTDPITGKQVLVVDAQVAGKLTGLSPSALRDPIRTIGMFPGLRLIPYHTVGNSGFLLALKIPNVKIGKRQESVLVAFSPLQMGNHYQALTGGMI